MISCVGSEQSQSWWVVEGKKEIFELPQVSLVLETEIAEESLKVCYTNSCGLR